MNIRIFTVVVALFIFGNLAQAAAPHVMKLRKLGYVKKQGIVTFTYEDGYGSQEKITIYPRIKKAIPSNKELTLFTFKFIGDNPDFVARYPHDVASSPFGKLWQPSSLSVSDCNETQTICGRKRDDDGFRIFKKQTIRTQKFGTNKKGITNQIICDVNGKEVVQFVGEMIAQLNIPPMLCDELRQLSLGKHENKFSINGLKMEPIHIDEIKENGEVIKRTYVYSSNGKEFSFSVSPNEATNKVMVTSEEEEAHNAFFRDLLFTLPADDQAEARDTGIAMELENYEITIDDNGKLEAEAFTYSDGTKDLFKRVCNTCFEKRICNTCFE